MRAAGKNFRYRLQKTLSSRITGQFLQGPVLVLCAFVLIHWLAPESAPPLRWVYLPPYLAFFFTILLVCNYRLISGRWNVVKWSGRLFLSGLPVPIFYGYLSYQVPLFFPVGAVGTIAAGLPVIGLIPRRFWILWYVAFITTCSLLFAWGRPGYLQANPAQVMIALAAFTAVFVWLIVLNDFTRKLNKKLTKNLIETRKRRRELHGANQELAEKNRRMERELRMARKVQQGILPDIARVLPAAGPVRARSRYLALDSVGGDYYDVVRLSDERIGFFIADVSGHGVSAALVTTMTKVAFTTHCGNHQDPAAVLNVINEELCRSIEDLNHYLTAYYCIFDVAAGRLSYASAGHPAALMNRRGAAEVIELATNPSFFIGVDPGNEYISRDIPLEYGDRVILYTDGLIEMESPAGEAYGDHRFTGFLREREALRGEEFIEELLEDLARFTDGGTPADDIAVVCIDYDDL